MIAKEFRLQQPALEKAVAYIQREGRDIDRAMYRYHFKKAKPAEVVEILRRYKNDDGGFGKGLELDYSYQGSTPQSTLRGLRILHQLKLIGNFNIISGALDYLYANKQKKGGWYCVTDEAHQAPIAPWYQKSAYQPDFTLNPTAEIVGYFYHFGGGDYRLFVNESLDTIKDYLRDERHGNEMHEVISFMRMIRLLPDSRTKRFLKYLKPRIDRKINLKPERYRDYVLSPLMIFENTYDPLYDKYESYVQDQLNDLVYAQEDEGYWEPNWQWGDQYMWEEMLPMVRAHVTLRNLLLLRNFHRIR